MTELVGRPVQQRARSSAALLEALRRDTRCALLSCSPQVPYRDGPQACEFQWHRKVGMPWLLGDLCSCALHVAAHMHMHMHMWVSNQFMARAL